MYDGATDDSPRPSPIRTPRMIRPTLTTFALLALALAPGSGLGAQEADAVLASASERFAAIRGVCARFEQTLTVPLLGEERTSRGRLCQMRPNLFRMDFSEPEGDLVVADGSHFWLYYASMNPNQVVQMPLDPARGGMDFYREFLDEPASKYEIRGEGAEQVTGRTTVKIHLTPLSERGYEEARVWIDPTERLIRRIEVVEENGSVRRITLSGIEVDPGLEADAFTYTPPEGVRVISG